MVAVGLDIRRAADSDRIADCDPVTKSHSRWTRAKDSTSSTGPFHSTLPQHNTGWLFFSHHDLIFKVIVDGQKLEDFFIFLFDQRLLKVKSVQ
ncbi:hypothetical protein SUGI_0921880 [Cryptomeria japonica]|nr:hypothetical protein SUGI_0921880 [Cryptomeria japonica]